MVHVDSQKDVLALNEISEIYHLNSLRYCKSLILYWMTLVVFEVEIPNLMCGCDFEWWSVLYHLFI